ncbi:MAG TPA: CDP-alcohol phosphatidyltransferase family protein [Flavisolibacter sp.]|nr:CDP-alcohol phosphatidyltransferase family protein [Flavisolibacter sp.]
MYKKGFYIVNAITLYRLLAAFYLLYLVIEKRADLFKWLLAISFFTDAIDGLLARRWKVVTEIGSRLDSIADDLTVLMAIIAMFVFKPEFVRDQLSLIILLTALYFLQLILAFVRYGKPTSFHTYLAKAAAAMQGIFLVLLFFLPQPLVQVFYIAALFTFLDLAEEIVLVLLLPYWQTDVKGLFWLKKIRHKI